MSSDREPSQPMPGTDLTVHNVHATGHARVYNAGRDQHLHLYDGERETRRTTPGGTGVCPYPGLAAFSAEQAEWFFGRDQLVADLITRAGMLSKQGGMLVVVAPSGAGKSSLLRAGLLPALAEKRLAVAGSDRWPHLVFTPTTDPVAVLAAQLSAVTGDHPGAVHHGMTTNSRAYLDRIRTIATARFATPGDPSASIVIVADQMEELFTLCGDERQRQMFIEWLALLGEPTPAGSPVALVVLGLRADFYSQCASYPKLWAALQRNQILVGPMVEADLRKAIRNPAQRVGLDLEPGLVELLLRDLGTTGDGSGDHAGSYEAGRLPFLAHALQATWQQRHGMTLTVAGYQATGGIAHAIATTAEYSYASLSSHDQRLARTLLLRLVKIGSGAEDTRRRMSPDDLATGIGTGDLGRVGAVLNTFTHARLLTQDQGKVEISHEALLSGWPRLRRWIDTDRRGHLLHQELEEAAAAWQERNHDRSMLYRGGRLEDANAWATPSALTDLSSRATAFLRASRRQQRRSTGLRYGVVAAITGLALVASGAALTALQQRQTAREQRDQAILTKIVAEADQLHNTDASLAAQLNLVAYRTAQRHPRLQPRPVQLATRLLDVQNRPLGQPMTGHTNTVIDVAFSPDGRLLASASDDRTVRLWNIADPAHPTVLGKPLTGHSAAVMTVAFSPDGRLLASGSDDRTVRLWNIADPAHPVAVGQPLTGQTGHVLAVAFSPDGRILVTGGNDESVRLWNVADPAHPILLGQSPTGHANTVIAAAFSRDGRQLATGSRDATVRLWNVSDPTRPTMLGPPLTGHTYPVVAAAFSPDGRTLATGSSDQTARLWNLADPAHPIALGQPLTGHTNPVLAVAFSPDGRTLATGSSDQTARLWNLADPAHPAVLGQPVTGHTGTVYGVAFSPDGRVLATGSDDRSVRLWSVADSAHPAVLGQPVTGHTGTVYGVAFSPDGRVLATGSDDRSVRLWNVADPAHPAVLGRLAGHTNTVLALAFSPDGRTLATGSRDGTARLWNVADPTHPAALGQPLTGHTDTVYAVAYSHDGQLLATGSRDGTVRLWEVADPTHPAAAGQPMTDHSDTVVSAAFSPDSRTLATGSADQTVRLWNVADPAHPAVLGRLAGHTSTVLAVAFSPDGRTLATGSADQTARLWKVKDPSHPAVSGEPLTRHTGGIWSIAFSPSGRTLATGSADQTAVRWDMEVDHAIDWVCAATGTSFTRRQWAKYVSNALTYSQPCP